MAIASKEIQALKPKYKLGLNKKLNEPAANDENNNEAQFQSLSKLNDHVNELIQNHVFLMFLELLKKISHDYKDKGLIFDDLKEKYLSYFQNCLNYSNLFCELLSANLETMDLTQLKQEINSNKHQTFIDKIHLKGGDQIDYSALNKSTSYDSPNVSPPLSPISYDGGETEEITVDVTKCYARTASHKQCSRKKQKGEEFCGSHLHNQPHGRIDNPLDPTKNKPKRRGRPPKNLQKQSTESQKQEVVQMDANIETINDIEYIVGNDGSIYKIPANFNPDDPINMDQLKLLGKKLSDEKITWYSETDLKFIDKSFN